MAIIESTARATKRSLMNKSKDELSTLCLQMMDQNGWLDSEIRRLRDALTSARWRLAKGRALWNGPCHECDAALHRGLTGEDIRKSASELELAALESASNTGYRGMFLLRGSTAHGSHTIRRFKTETEAERYRRQADLSAWKRVWISKSQPSAEQSATLKCPWSVERPDGFRFTYLRDADGRRIASLLGTAEQRERLAAILADAGLVADKAV